MEGNNKVLKRVYVWQLPVRIYHWLNALCIVILSITGYLIGNPPAIQSSAEASFGYWFGEIRFIHFVMAGLVLGVSVPIGLIYLMLQFDPRIRFSQIITTDLDIPVLAEISNIPDLKDKAKNLKVNILIFIGVSLVMIIHGYVVWLKLQGKI